MDAGEAFRQGLGSVNKARESRAPRVRESSHESDEHPQRVAHTLAACCRCRQRKTRCDPTLPRCIGCERSGTVCEYFDTAKGRKISRTYVIKLQEKVRDLEEQLSQFTDEDLPPLDTEDSIRPGGLVRLDENDDSPRFLGPSSGIAMTRLVMEEAKRYTDSRSIRELVPEVSSRRTPVSSPGEMPWRKKSYPMISAVPAEKLPTRLVTDKLMEVFHQKAQYTFPIIHEAEFARELEEVYAGDPDPYKNFVTSMVLAISLQKLDTQWAGLADSYYLAAMLHVEAVIRPKDLRTLQCLVLIAQYSLLTPTRTAIYYIVGLAVRIAQQLGLTEEKTITQGVAQGLVNPLQMDMRRRLSWIVLNMEFGLSHSLGRPNGYAIGHDEVDVGFFAKIDDDYITKEGLLPAPISEKKVMCIHFFKMRLLQAEIRRVLYQTKRETPKDEHDPWYQEMEAKLRKWVDTSPSTPSWSKPWFTSKYNTMVIFLYRPSPQVPRPSAHGAMVCYDAAAFNIRAQAAQMDNPSVDITWIWLLSLFMVVNTILWAISYPEVRQQHNREELEMHIQTALAVIERCIDRWPGSATAYDLYSKLSKACLRSYDSNEVAHGPASLPGSSPASYIDAASPASEHSNATTLSFANSQASANQKPFEYPPAFGYVFGQAPDQTSANEYHNNLNNALRPPAPAFRSNSIFGSPGRAQVDRRFSYFPPELSQEQQPSNGWVPTTQPSVSSQNMPMHSGQMNNMSATANNMNAPPVMMDLPRVPDPTYFIQSPFNFGPHLYAEQSYASQDTRMGSLSQQQQRELMEELETTGMTGIENYLALAPPYHGNSTIAG